MTRRTALTGAAATAATAVTAGVGMPDAVAAPAVRGGRPGRGRTLAARRRFFGAANVDSAGRVRPDRVILSWFGCTSFAMAIGGHVVLLDAWVPRGTYSGRVPTSVAEVADLSPSHVFIGHGHFDHAADAAPIASASSAVVVGTPEHCAQVTAQAARHTGRDTPRTRTAPLRLPDLGDEDELRLGRHVRVTALRHVHSTAKPPTGEAPPLLLPPDLTPVLTHPPTVEDGVDTLSHQTDAEGGSLLYRFDLGAFSLTWHDTAGPLREDAPELPSLLGRRRRSTVHVGAVQGFGQYTNGLRDPLDYVAAVRPRVFVPSHHDNWTPPASTGAAGYEQPLRDGLATLPERSRPSLRFIEDTRDYLNPRRLTFPLR